MDITKLRHIVAVADSGSFSRAAEEQHITQPALSRSIAAFEERHGVRLFDRGRGGTYITPSGAFLIEQARDLLRSADNLARNLKRHGEGGAGRLALGIGPLLASLLLPQLGSRVLDACPGLELETLIRAPELLVADLVDGRVEMVVGNIALIGEMPGLLAAPIGQVALAFAVRAGHPLAGVKGLTLADLGAYPAACSVRFANDASTAGAFVCDNFHILRETARTSDCTWLTAPAFIAADLRTGSMALLDVTDLPMTHSGVHIITRIGRSLSPAGKIISELLVAMLQDMDSAA